MSYINLKNEPDDLIPGIEEVGDPIEIGMEDDDLITALTKRIRDSQAFWEEDQKLKGRRKMLEDYWKGEHRLRDMYDYQLPAYVDNRVYMHVEHITQVGNSQIAEPVVTAFRRSQEQKAMAEEFGDYLKAYAENHGWLNINRIVTRNLLLQFLGVKKIWWNPNMGPISRKTGQPLGNVDIGFVRPGNVIIDQYAKPLENPSIVTEIIREPVELVMDRFPAKKNEIKNMTGKGKLLTYYETHFTYLNKDGAPREGQVWFSDKLNKVFDKKTSADWDEEGEQENGETVYKNMLDMPGKPYAFLTMNNLGKLFIDDTSPIEQFLPLQDILNQRGQQIKDNAEEVRGSKVFNKRLIDKEDAARFNNDPGSHIMTKGDVRQAVANVIPPIVPDWVVQDKLDARTEGDNIVGVHGPTRGERQGTDQPTTVQLLKEGDFQRASDLIAGIERMDEYTYRYAAHLMKLNYTEEHYESVMGEDGRKTFIMMGSKDIPQSGITVKAGTTLPTDKLTQREEALELGRMDKLDYLTFFERLGFPNPREQAKKLYRHLTDPEGLYIGDADKDEAEEDVERLKAGVVPELPDIVSEVYMNEIIEFSKSDEFQELDQDRQQIAQEYIQLVIDAAKTRVEELQNQPQVPVEPEQQGQPGVLQQIGGAVKSGANKLLGR